MSTESEATRTSPGRVRTRSTLALCALLLAVIAIAVPVDAVAEQASQPASPAAGQLDVSGGGDTGGHTCAVLADATLRCWGFGGNGRLGYGSTSTIGDDETPGATGPVDLGVGRTTKAIAAGGFHTCGLLDDNTVRCWGYGGDGRLGYASTNDIGDNEPPGSVGPVDLGSTVKAITAGGGHTCALLEDNSVRCWGFGGDGRLGYANRNTIGDNETPRSAGAVDLGGTAMAVTAGQSHTCALLEDNSVRCWGFGANGQLGYGNTTTIGDNETPGSAGAVDLGSGHTAKAISAGAGHTCALLEDDSVRCWGYGGNGRLGYANTTTIGDDEKPGSAGPVDLGGHKAKAISAGDNHTCALLDDNTVRCWGYGGEGRLGYASTSDVGDNETPGSMGPVDLGPNRTAVAISAGGRHTCARLDDFTVRCWGSSANGRLGYCNANDIGDNESPGSVGPVDVRAPGFHCGGWPPNGDAAFQPTSGVPPRAGANRAPAVGSDARRASGLRGCLVRVARHARRETARARHGSRGQRARARRHARRHESSGRRRCLRLYGRAPGRVTGFTARALSKKTILLTFTAPGTNGSHPPVARTYLVKQSLHPMRSARSFQRAQTLCNGKCRFYVTQVGARITLTVTDLRPHTTYYYAMAARDNVSARPGPRSRTVKVRVRR